MTNAVEAADRALAQRARDKIAAGERPNREERRALTRVDKDAEREAAKRAIQNIPKKLYIEWTGRQSKVLNEQAERYGIPIAGETIDGAAVFRWIHDTFSKHSRELLRIMGVRSRLQVAEDLDDDLVGLAGDGVDGEKWLSRCREKKSHLLDLELRQKEGSLIPRDDMYAILTRSGGMLRQLEEDLERRFGSDAADMAKAAREGLEREVMAELDRDAA